MTENGIVDVLDAAKAALDHAEKRLDQVEAERNAILAYAAFLLVDSTEPPAQQFPKILAAIDRLLKFSRATVNDLSAKGWGDGDVVCLLNCRDIVRSLP